VGHVQKRILVVDDSPTIRQQVIAALRPIGYELIEAGDGVEGASKLETEQDIGLVILDVDMPRMNGIAMLEAIKGGGKHPDLHVIMLTSEGQQSLIERAKKAGARGWIVKPFKVPLLVAAVKRLIP
jgi:two-component system, chemotaxis family, chemotaxis protein CheY